MVVAEGLLPRQATTQPGLLCAGTQPGSRRRVNIFEWSCVRAGGVHLQQVDDCLGQCLHG